MQAGNRLHSIVYVPYTRHFACHLFQEEPLRRLDHAGLEIACGPLFLQLVSSPEDPVDVMKHEFHVAMNTMTTSPHTLRTRDRCGRVKDSSQMSLSPGPPHDLLVTPRKGLLGSQPRLRTSKQIALG